MDSKKLIILSFSLAAFRAKSLLLNSLRISKTNSSDWCNFSFSIETFSFASVTKSFDAPKSVTKSFKVVTKSFISVTKSFAAPFCVTKSFASVTFRSRSVTFRSRSVTKSFKVVTFSFAKSDSVTFSFESVTFSFAASNSVTKSFASVTKSFESKTFRFKASVSNVPFSKAVKSPCISLATVRTSVANCTISAKFAFSVWAAFWSFSSCALSALLVF